MRWANSAHRQVWVNVASRSHSRDPPSRPLVRAPDRRPPSTASTAAPPQAGAYFLAIATDGYGPSRPTCPTDPTATARRELVIADPGFPEQNNQVLNAMRGDLTDLRGEFTGLREKVNDGFIEMRGRLDVAAAGQQRITDLLTTVIEGRFGRARNSRYGGIGPRTTRR